MSNDNKRSKIVGKLFYRVSIENVSPFSIGGFDSDISQHDILVDYSNTPYIPGSSLKGSMIRGLSEDEARSLGTCLINTDQNFPISNLFISNAYPYPVDADQDTIRDNSKKVKEKLSIRDGIKIDHDTDTVIDGAKYDYEIIQSGAVFYFDIEVTCRESDSNSISDFHNMIIKMLTKINSGDIRFGFKTTRGLGLFKVNTVKYGMFGNNCLMKLKDALDENNHYSNVLDLTEAPESSDFIILTCDVTNPNGLIIRTQPELDDSEVNHTDSVQITDNGIAVIPGTSLNGALQSSIYKLCQYLNITAKNKLDYNKKVAPFFGQYGEEDSGKSSVFVEETKLDGGNLKSITRTCINRFSGSAKNGALFTENIYFGGQGTIKIKVRIDDNNNEWFVGLLVIALDSISIGETAIGGEKAIGRGKLLGGDIKVTKHDPDYYVEKLQKELLKEPNIPCATTIL